MMTNNRHFTYGTANKVVTNLFLFSFNTKGQQNEVKRKKQYQLAREVKADILFLQETHSQPEVERIWGNQYGGEQSFFSHGESNARGVSTHFKRGLDVKICEVCRDPEGRYLWIQAKIQGRLFGLLNIYAPNTEKKQVLFFKKIQDFLINKKKRNRDRYRRGL